MMLGDHVKLQRDLAQQLSFGCRGQHKKVNWLKRTGTIVSIGKPSNALGQAIGVQWHGRRTPDYWPPKALVIIK